MTAAPSPPRNGVDTAALFATLDAVKQQPEIAKFRFTASNTWVTGTHSHSTSPASTAPCRTWNTNTDRARLRPPGGSGGADNGPTPVEYLLHALAACLTAGLANIAAARNVNLTRVTSTVSGDIDLLGSSACPTAPCATDTARSGSPPDRGRRR